MPLDKQEPEDLTPDEAKELGRLLDKVAALERAGRKFPIPEPAFEPMHRVVPYPAIDMVTLDNKGRVLMVKRNDKYFRGWELVGGYGHWSESLGAWCKRLARRDVGADVELVGFTGIHKWMPGEHPHGAPISLVALARLASPVTKVDVEVDYFTSVPDGMVPNHSGFMEVSLKALQTGKIIPSI